MNRAGQHLSFILTYEKAGLFLEAIKKAIRMMRDRLFAKRDQADAVIGEALVGAVDVIALTLGRDSETRDILLCFDTSDSAAFSFRLNEKAARELVDLLLQSKDEEDIRFNQGSS